MTVLDPPGVGEAGAAAMLPALEPLTLIDGPSGTRDLDDSVLLELYRLLVRGRRYNLQATALTKQGRLAVYPSTTGQEACEAGAVPALDERNWNFATYQDTLALLVRGIDPVEVDPAPGRLTQRVRPP